MKTLWSPDISLKMFNKMLQVNYKQITSFCYQAWRSRMCSQSISREDLTDIPKECGYVPYSNQSDCSVRETVSRNLTREHSHPDHSWKTLSAQKQPINSYHACLSHCWNLFTTPSLNHTSALQSQYGEVYRTISYCLYSLLRKSVSEWFLETTKATIINLWPVLE